VLPWSVRRASIAAPIGACRIGTKRGGCRGTAGRMPARETLMAVYRSSAPTRSRTPLGARRRVHGRGRLLARRWPGSRSPTTAVVVPAAGSLDLMAEGAEGWRGGACTSRWVRRGYPGAPCGPKPPADPGALSPCPAGRSPDPPPGGHPALPPEPFGSAAAVPALPPDPFRLCATDPPAPPLRPWPTRCRAEGPYGSFGIK